MYSLVYAGFHSFFTLIVLYVNTSWLFTEPLLSLLVSVLAVFSTLHSFYKNRGRAPTIDERHHLMISSIWIGVTIETIRLMAVILLGDIDPSFILNETNGPEGSEISFSRHAFTYHYLAMFSVIVAAYFMIWEYYETVSISSSNKQKIDKIFNEIKRQRIAVEANNIKNVSIKKYAYIYAAVLISMFIVGNTITLSFGFYLSEFMAIPAMIFSAYISMVVFGKDHKRPPTKIERKWLHRAGALGTFILFLLNVAFLSLSGLRHLKELAGLGLFELLYPWISWFIIGYFFTFVSYTIVIRCVPFDKITRSASKRT